MYEYYKPALIEMANKRMFRMNLHGKDVWREFTQRIARKNHLRCRGCSEMITEGSAYWVYDNAVKYHDYCFAIANKFRRETGE